MSNTARPHPFKISQIVHCYPSKIIENYSGNFKDLVASFEAIGFKASQKAEGKVLLKMGESFAFTFQYSSEGVQIQVLLEQKGDDLEIKVGNWGFPFEPLLMKKRFIKNLEHFHAQISQEGVVSRSTEEQEVIAKETGRVKRNTSALLFGLIIYIIIVQFLNN